MYLAAELYTVESLEFVVAQFSSSSEKFLLTDRSVCLRCHIVKLIIYNMT